MDKIPELIKIIITALCCGFGGAVFGALAMALVAADHQQAPREFGDIFRKGKGIK